MPSHPFPPRIWDVFCQVIDNFGDIGVCWRLASQLAARGETVRLWVDDASALAWMAPERPANVQVLPWPEVLDAGTHALLAAAPPQVLVEAFGCEPPDAYLTELVRQAGPRQPAWINLEYLSAEAYVARSHRLPSLLASGPAAGWTRWFFYPGFTPDTGGLLREAGLPARQAAFDRADWRARHGLPSAATQVSLFCYEPPGLAAWWRSLAASPLPLALAVTAGRATAAVQSLLKQELPALDAQATQIQNASESLPIKREQLQFLPLLPQPAFDELLWASDLNFVRGEDSLVRALWAGQPLVWHIYPQHDDAHHDKLLAFLDWLDAPASLRQAHLRWNGLPGADDDWPALTPALLAEWRDCVLQARARLLAQTDLASQLLTFAAEKG
ncbi:elongation factor P maturation arginine rhamnosyltransferase EarP [Comamonas humi]